MQTGEHKDLPVWQFTSLADWLAWLETNHGNYPKGIWVKIAKKNKGVTTTSYDDVREGALCYGWIDSLPNKVDDTFYVLKVTPRRPKSVWSKINVALCETFITEGKMKPSGLAEIIAAQNDGRWAIAYGNGEKPRRPEN